MNNNDFNINDKPNLPLNNNGKNPFGLPDDYFLKFEDQLKQKLELENELTDFSILSSIKKTKVFAVPNQYFESAENTLEYKTELEHYSNLKSITKPLFTSLEEDYKQQFKSSINQKIELADELNSYNVLYSIDKVNAFMVSDTYFEKASELIKQKLVEQKQSKVSVLDKILDVIFGKKLAFAFGLVTIISLSLYFFKPSEKPLDINDCKTLACLEKQEILNNSKVISNFDEEQLMDLVDVNALNKQLNSSQQKTNSKTDKNINSDSINEDDLLDML